MSQQASGDLPEEPSGVAGPVPAQPQVLRADRSRLIAWIGLGAAGLAAVLVLVQVPLDRSPAILGLPVLIACVCWACYLRPRVELGAGAVTFVNVASVSTIPFSRIDEFDLRLGLTVRTTDGRRYGAWALPGSGRKVTRERWSRLRMERHVPEEIRTVMDAHSRWRGDRGAPGRAVEGRAVEGRAAPGRAADSDDARSAVTLFPPALLVLALAWAAWGLSTVAAF